MVIIDTEVATDKRSRSSVFPDIKRDGSLLRMTTEIPAYQRQRLARHVDPPHETEILRWMLDLRNSVYGDVRALQRMGIVSTDARAAYRTVRYLQAEALESTRRARSLADFNMIFASRVMNLAWGLPIAFISLTDCVPHMQAAYEQILARYDDMVTSSKTALVSLRERGFFVSEAMHFDPSEFPLWLICECFSRVAMAIRPTAALSITGRCASCGATHSYDLGARASPDLASLCRRLVPRMLFDDLTNPTIWNVAAGISNAGSVRHILPMYETARTLGLEVPPEALLRLRGIYFGPAELRLAAAADELTAPDRAALWRIYWGRASIVYYLVSAGVEGLRDMWRSWFSGSESIAGVNVGVNRFSLEPRQEAWLRSTMNAIPPR